MLYIPRIIKIIIFIYTMTRVQIIIAVITVIVLYWVATFNTGSYEMYMDGLWISTDEFNKMADIELMTVYLGPPQGYFSSRREGVIVIVADGSEIAQGFNISYSSGWGGVGIGEYKITASIKFDDDQIMEPVVDISIDMMSGTMVISRGDITYGVFAKDLTMRD